ncbi:uncharacterized protein [Linepithema humile]|uniref:uncharacterized protein n=1 Tax=Linepithema humile TaxID=83485 RepID=UPI00351E44AE
MLMKEVKKFLILPKNSCKRRTLIGSLRKKGNYKFNTHSDLNDGTMVVVRRPNNKTKLKESNFLPCPKCEGHYSKNNLRHHFRLCAKKQNTFRNVMQLAQSAAKSVHNRACVKLKTRIIPIIREGNIRDLIRYDLLIILYGNYLCQKHRLQHQDDHIRTQLRLLGRYLQELEEIEPQIKELQMLFDPKHYDLPYMQEQCLKKLCKILITECIRQHDKKKQITVKNFKKILEMQYGYTVNKTVAETLSTKNRYKKVELPQSSDIIKFNQYLEEKKASNMEILQNQFSFNTWKSLSEVTLIIIQIFNRRRAGELERILISDYKNSIKMTDTDKEYKQLQKSEKV